MNENEVRLKYSGYILFLSRLIAVGTGLLFVLMITRNISETEFGIYNNISDILIYFTIPSEIIPFWTTRFTARKHAGSSKTGLVSNLFLSLPFALLYLIFLPRLLGFLNLDTAYMVVYGIVVIQMVESYALVAFEAILRAIKPEMIGLGLLTFDISKVIIGFFLIVNLNLGLLGALICVIIANVLRFIFYIRLIWSDLKEKVRWKYVREWIKASPINLYGILGQRLFSIALIYLFVKSGEIARGYYGAASAIANIVGYSSFLAFALYPRLLSGNKKLKSEEQDVKTSLKMVLMFAIPMLTGALILSNSYLAILNPTYKIAKDVLIILALNAMFVSTSSVFDMVMIGTEKIDVEAKIPLKKLVKSKLFIIFTLSYIKAAFTILLTFVALTSLKQGAIEAATTVAVIVLSTNITLFLVKYMLANKYFKFGLPWKHIIKYIVSAVIMGFFLIILPHIERLSFTLVLTAVGGIIYLLALSIIDQESRATIKLIVKGILRVIKGKAL
jgi:O-antigen/teichoic acid export membrane protein